MRPPQLPETPILNWESVISKKDEFIIAMKSLLRPRHIIELTNEPIGIEFTLLPSGACVSMSKVK